VGSAKIIKIVHEGADFWVVHKPPGLSFHKDHQDGRGFFSTLRDNFPGQELYPVHRLDKITSGLILVARKRRVAAELSALFAAGEVEKYYLALSDRRPKKKRGWLKGDMRRGRRGSWRLTKEQLSPAITYFFSRSIGSGFRLYLLRPYTGKSHQLRVALKAIGAPVLNDPLYYPCEKDARGDRAYLHAYFLKFSWRGETVKFKALPDSGPYFLRAEFREVLGEVFAHPDGLQWPKP